MTSTIAASSADIVDRQNPLRVWIVVGAYWYAAAASTSVGVQKLDLIFDSLSSYANDHLTSKWVEVAVRVMALHEEAE